MLRTSKPGVSLPLQAKAALLPIVAVSLALIALLTLAAAGFGSRLGLWHFRTGFTLLKYGAWGGAAALTAALAGAIRAAGKRNMAALFLSLLAMVLGSVAFAVPLQWKLTAQRLPRIHDITTDTANPPSYVALLPLRKDAANPIEYGGPAVAAQQQQAYPDLRTVILDLQAPQAFDRALEAAGALGWKIVAAVPEEGRIEATDTTFWFGFTDDIVVRITPAGYRSLLDVRSLSRVGVSDAGTNAKRIRAFLQKMGGNR